MTGNSSASQQARQAARARTTYTVCTEYVCTSSAPCRQSISGRDGSSAQDICKAFQNQTNRVPRRITYYAHPNATDRSIKDRAPRSYSVGRLLLSRKEKKKGKRKKVKADGCNETKSPTWPEQGVRTQLQKDQTGSPQLIQRCNLLAVGRWLYVVVGCSVLLFCFGPRAVPSSEPASLLRFLVLGGAAPRKAALMLSWTLVLPPTSTYMIDTRCNLIYHESTTAGP